MATPKTEPTPAERAAAEPVGSLKWMQAIHDFVQDSQPKKPKP